MEQIAYIIGNRIVHSKAVVGHGYEHVATIRRHVHVYVQGTFVTHGMPHGILNDGLHQETRYTNLLEAGFHMLGLHNAILSKSRLLNGEVASRLLELLI
jgi:hypothetical protein